MNARHSKKNPNWVTPPELIELFRSAHGGRIDLDPFSSLKANAISVNAERIWTVADDGFAQDWEMDAGSINPPGGLVKKAWRKLCAEIMIGRARRAFWTGFSVEQLCVLADPNLPGESEEARFSRGGFHPTDFTHVYLRKRIDFVDEETGLPGGSPSHGNYLTCPGVPHQVVVEHFGSGHHGYVGRVVRGPLSVDA